jgi:hypothetical protein
MKFRGIKDWWKSLWLDTSRPTPAGGSAGGIDFNSLPWLEPDQNPFGLRVLDCRSVAASLTSASQDADSIAFFGSAESRSGLYLWGLHPEDALQLSCDLRYERITELANGPLFLASEMEEKWNIYHFDGALYFARSWTGRLDYLAHTQLDAGLHVEAVEARPGNVLGPNEMAIKAVDYLIRSHILNERAPHPAPPLTDKKSLAMWSFSQYGRRGLFAYLFGP